MKKSFLFTLVTSIALIGVLARCESFGNRTEKETTNSTWTSIRQIQWGFRAIEPYKTKTDNLAQFGFGENSPNVKKIDYLRLQEYLLGSNKDSGKDILPQAVQTCLSLKDACKGLVVKVRDTNKQGLESFSSRVLNGQKTTEITGWEFEAVIVLQSDLVVYAKPRNEESNIRTMTEEKDPRSLWEKMMAPVLSLGSLF